MSILSVDQIQPIGSGTTVTLNATEVKTGTEITVGTGASIFSPAGNTLTFGTNNVERIRIKNDGKVGIGTDNPSNALDVQGGTTNTAIVARSTDAKAQISLVDNSTTSVGSVVVGAEGDNLFFTSGSSGAERLRINSSGRVGINQSNPARALTVNAQGTGTSSRLLRLATQDNSTRFDFSFENTDFLTIQNGVNDSAILKLHKSGYVTKPNTPAFQVAKTNGDVSANNYVIFNQVYYNNGSHYNTSDGKFTAPVTGIYHFYAWHFTNGTSQFRIDLNGSSWQGANTLWDDVGGHASWTMPMTSGQYVQIYTQSYSWRGSANYHNAFGGYLIG